MAAPGRKKVESALIVRSAFGEIYEHAWLRALRDLGINAELFDTHSYIPANLAGRVEQHYVFGPHIGKVNRMVLERAREMRPDVVHFYQGHHYTAETIAKVAKIAFASGSHCDDPFGRRESREYRLLKEALPEYDAYHVNRQCNLGEPPHMASSECASLRRLHPVASLSMCAFRRGTADVGFGRCVRRPCGARFSH